MAYNGWPASPDPAAIGVDRHFTAGGVTFPGGVVAGPVAAVFRDLAEQYTALIEPLVQGWCWGYEYRTVRGNPSRMSCHAAGTALDLNAPIHPQGVAGTFSDLQTSALSHILLRYDGLVTWGGDFYGRVDEMHWEITGGPEDISELANRLEGSNGAQNPIEETDVALSAEDIEAVAQAVMQHLQTDPICQMEVYSSSGLAHAEKATITRVLQSAQVQSARTYQEVT